MKYLTEYRDAGLSETLLKKIKTRLSRPWNIMEVCGGQTHSLVKNGILQLLPPQVRMIHGPGCPVCVTPIDLIDKAIELATREDVVLCSFGDMMRVPGSTKSLLQAKAEGADIRMVYSPLDAINLARQNPHRQVVFFAVGFETTAPANALSVLQAHRLDLNNYAILTSHVLVPPAIEAIMSDPDCQVDGFLAAGHVCAIMGSSEYLPIAKKYQVPIVITGFEPLDLLQGISSLIELLESGKIAVENQYSRAVDEQGNLNAIKTITEVFEIKGREWRGIGEIPLSGYELKEKYRKFDARYKYSLSSDTHGESLQNECIAGDILKGIKKPFECPHFGKKCNPEHPLGAPMVSSEGACAAYYHYYDRAPSTQKMAIT